MTEEEKAERKIVIANNKAWDSAEKVRRNHLTEFFAGRKSAPKGAAAFVAQIVLRHPDFLSDLARNRQVLTEILGRPVPSTGQYDYRASQDSLREVARLLDGASDKHALVLTLAMVCAGVEARTSRSCWRGAHEPFGMYLRFLSESEIGYELSDVERLAIPTAEKPDTVYDVDLDPEPGSDEDGRVVTAGETAARNGRADNRAGDVAGDLDSSPDEDLADSGGRPGDVAHPHDDPDGEPAAEAGAPVTVLDAAAPARRSDGSSLDAGAPAAA